MPCILVSFALVTVAAGGITSGRAQAIGALLVGLISVIIGGLALSRAAGDRGTGKARSRAIVAVIVGLIGMALGGLRVASSTAIGTGSGRLGGIVAIVVALIGTLLGGLALARAQRAKPVKP